MHALTSTLLQLKIALNSLPLPQVSRQDPRRSAIPHQAAVSLKNSSCDWHYPLQTHIYHTFVQLHMLS